ncbi:hypothetical protein AN639_07290 [Candidatus Epulonipiscium fishelsonii]|uniref:Uncharacterized protein n=1 Tax=Candidatus Epulonipiscium fishelsonii TaxID=77094 RepID=A0ACC8XA52_9FIRM|nr:hypothetical protein AN639_07290 [Epulopiscium sp. SCG-B05WGA-EpuloA1]ONI39053.1 hypothetical protein AN396_09270 [Epulopiscium sp. SCG-B11WGA-EpuloA1]ONI47673.1 hypothetical protein AN644_04320 [Epulopiscium sp. SCG-C06WGA-EpuloA1]
MSFKKLPITDKLKDLIDNEYRSELFLIIPEKDYWGGFFCEYKVILTNSIGETLFEGSASKIIEVDKKFYFMDGSSNEYYPDPMNIIEIPKSDVLSYVIKKSSEESSFKGIKYGIIFIEVIMVLDVITEDDKIVITQDLKQYIDSSKDWELTNEPFNAEDISQLRPEMIRLKEKIIYNIRLKVNDFETTYPAIYYNKIDEKTTEFITTDLRRITVNNKYIINI